MQSEGLHGQWVVPQNEHVTVLLTGSQIKFSYGNRNEEIAYLWF